MRHFLFYASFEATLFHTNDPFAQAYFARGWSWLDCATPTAYIARTGLRQPDLLSYLSTIPCQNLKTLNFLPGLFARKTRGIRAFIFLSFISQL